MSKEQEVVCIDNLFSGKKFNLKKWENHPNFSFIEHDITNPISLNVDRIWHFSCPASSLFYKKDSLKTLNVCFNGTLNLLELARENNAKFLLSSSSEVYGKAEKYPQNESYNGSVNPFGPRSCYSEGKRISESLCYAYKEQYGLNISIARLFNVFGPRMSFDDGRVITNFIGNALQKKNICINGNGKQTRSFCFINDIVEGLVKLMDSNYSLPVNLGNPKEEYAIIDVANIILKILDLDLPFEFNSFITDEPLRRSPDISLARKILLWEPKKSFKYGLEKTIKEFKFN